jgi:hypothetical protein
LKQTIRTKILEAEIDLKRTASLELYKGRRYNEIHTAESPVLEPSAFEVKVASETLQKFKLPGTYQIPAEMIQAKSRTIHSEIHNL